MCVTYHTYLWCAGKIFTVLYAPFAVVFVGGAIGYIAQVGGDAAKRALSSERPILSMFLPTQCMCILDACREADSVHNQRRIYLMLYLARGVVGCDILQRQSRRERFN